MVRALVVLRALSPPRTYLVALSARLDTIKLAVVVSSVQLEVILLNQVQPNVLRARLIHFQLLVHQAVTRAKLDCSHWRRVFLLRILFLHVLSYVIPILTK